MSRLLDTYFTTAPDGIPGNDDAGTMSAWAVFSMMGLYPDCPGVPEYSLTLPTFDKVTIHLNPEYYDSETITIEKTSAERPRVTLGNKQINNRVSHDDLIKGRNLKFFTKEK